MSLDLRPGLSGLAPDALAAWLGERGQPGYRVRQVSEAVWAGGATNAASVQTLPADLRADIDAAFRLDTLVHTEVRAADGGRTEKALHQLVDGALVE